MEVAVDNDKLNERNEITINSLHDFLNRTGGRVAQRSIHRDYRTQCSPLPTKNIDHADDVHTVPDEKLIQTRQQRLTKKPYADDKKSKSKSKQHQQQPQNLDDFIYVQEKKRHAPRIPATSAATVTSPTNHHRSSHYPKQSDTRSVPDEKLTRFHARERPPPLASKKTPKTSPSLSDFISRTSSLSSSQSLPIADGRGCRQRQRHGETSDARSCHTRVNCDRCYDSGMMGVGEELRDEIDLRSLPMMERQLSTDTRGSRHEVEEEKAFEISKGDSVELILREER